MKLYFKPMPGLTIVTLICLAILISLGTWQYQRLQWKTELLAEIEEAATAPPFASFVDVQEALAAGDPVDFRRFGAEVKVLSFEQPFLVFTSQNKDISWRVFTPIRRDSVTVFAGLNTVPDSKRGVGQTVRQAIGLNGYVRLAREAGSLTTKSTPEKNRWFGFNPMPETVNWADKVVGDVETRFYIDGIPEATSAADLPIKRPDIRNNHLDYMLTWYSFAIILFVIYLILHARNGRLGYKRS